ncbi:tyrosine recombinase XerC [Aquibacillus albus]|uniref:Tyrosine recombinase XerC n=1 Tax=Aquibacillus albus TaxID=1168171 RepID=A0ABS2N0Z6_9BACI|nr:tyrosine recombinase XerC [Aquibacillus albus]MBM7571811.1 integrase/recombinase XerC [Aquibacillus albus]
MDHFLQSESLFVEYLKIEKNASPYTVTYYREDIQSFFTFLKREGITHLQSVDYQFVRVFLTFLYEKGLSRRSVARKISSLRSLYKFLERESIVSQNPFINVSTPKIDKPVPEFFYKQELDKLFTVNDLTDPLGQRNQAILEILYATGIRVSECVGLTLNDVDFDLNTLLVLGKGRKERYVPFGSYARTALKLYVDDGRNELLQKAKANNTKALFLNAKGNQLTTKGVRLVLDKIVKAAALTIDIHPHKLRHTFATHMLNEGADLRVVQELLGHEHLSSTQVYTHVTKDRLRNVYMNSHPRARNGK